MTDDRIPTDVWVSAQMRRCSAEGTPFYVIRRGAFAAGTVVVKILQRGKSGCQVFNQARDIEGKSGWMDVFDGAMVDEKRADAYIQRSIERDPDVWAVEIETADGKNPFEGKVF